MIVKALKIIAITLLLIKIFPLETCLAQVTPRLNVYDEQGALYSAPDNSTQVQVSPGSLFKMEITGYPYSPYGIFMSLKTTPYPLNIIPPPLFILAPIFPVYAGPDLILDAGGQGSFYGIIPSTFTTLPFDLSLYFQGFVQDPVNGFQLTNGIRMIILKSKYRAKITLAQGESLSNIHTIGTLSELDAEDNLALPSGGLENGELILKDPNLANKNYGFDDISPTPPGLPNPSTSIFLNKIYPLIPGDTGLADFNVFLNVNHPEIGSSPFIHTRDRICRNNENRHNQFIIVPRFDSSGKKTADLDIHHFRDKDSNEFGFFVNDRLTGGFYELKGSRKENTVTDRSPWSPYVAVSPDGLYMAAVLKDQSGSPSSGSDQLFIFKLGENETWGSGDHGRKVTLKDATNNKYIPSRIFSETLTFGGDPAHVLFFVCNKYDSTALTPTEPPVDQPAVLWSTHAAKENGPQSKGTYIKITDMPLTGNNHNTSYFGAPYRYNPPNDVALSELRWLVSDNRETICFRAAGRESQWDKDKQKWILGDWAWNMFSITKINSALDFKVTNITGFLEAYIFPFGHAYNGGARGAINKLGTAVLYVSSESNSSFVTDLHLTPTDGTHAGKVFTITHKNHFITAFENTRGVLDPFFIDHNTVVFFCGAASGFVSMDLFLYEANIGVLTNLTNTAKHPSKSPPYSKFGTIRPAGLFMSRNEEHLFFFRGTSSSSKINLKGVNIKNNHSVYDLTGSEFSSGFIPDLATKVKSNPSFFLDASFMSLFFAPTDNFDLILFTTPYFENSTNNCYQVFMLNAEFPLAAIPITSFDPYTETGVIDNLTADSSGAYVAFSRSNVYKKSWTHGANEKIFIVDLYSGAYMRDLCPNNNYNNASIDGSLIFLESPSFNTPAGLIYGLGAAEADNPQKARIMLYPLEGVSDPKKPSLSFPLTQEELYLLFDAKPLK